MLFRSSAESFCRPLRERQYLLHVDQRALCRLGANITIDGAVGPKTLAAIAEHPTEAVAQEYLRVREAFYRGLVSRDPKQGNFLQGWMNRLEKIRRGLGL